VNCDGAFLASEGRGGGGAVLRDHHGDSLMGGCRFFHSAMAPERAELLACRLAVTEEKDAGATKLLVESDCLGLVKKLGTTELDRLVHGPLIEDIKALLCGFEEVQVQHVRRMANEVANRLAKKGCRNNVCETWVGVPPM
jgi:ribonuclease HI